MTITITRVVMNNEIWFNIIGSDVFVDIKLLNCIRAKGVEIIDQDAKKLEREYQSKWN